ncbi:GCN5 family acetyltransferase [Streptomyces sp. NRRL B-1568]|nr:GCN5 family acetyltransferase [Streptomyces sp. NRRL B-1568]
MAGNGLEIRKGGADDVPAILDMLDGAIEWLVAHGSTGQWGTQPWSARPRAVAQLERIVSEGAPWIAEIDGVPAGTAVLTPYPTPQVAPADEPEVYVHLLVSDRRFAGRGVGAALLAHAAQETRQQGIGLLRVDCYAGNEGRLVAFYEGQGFTRTETFRAGEGGEWPGQVLARRV